MADLPDYTVQPRPLQVEGAISSHDLAIRDLIDWDYPELTHEAQVLLDERKEYGLGKYLDEQGRGVPLHKDNGRDHVRDALDEALDLVAYLRTWMDAEPQLGDLVRPMYLNALTMLCALANWRVNQQGPELPRPLPGPEWGLWATMPNQHPANISRDELSSLDNGIVMMWPADGANEEGVVCGGLQRDEHRCVRPLTEVMGELECPRHGVRRRS